MAERFKAHAWKVCVPSQVPWVRIPLSPPLIRSWSKIINSNTYYYNTEKENDETIINKIVDRVIKDVR